MRVNYMVHANGDSYLEDASSKSTKTIKLYGQRGTIYDTNMVPLAYDRTSYNVTFYRDPSRSSEAERSNYTQILIKTIELIESNGKNTLQNFWMKQNENGKWVFDSGSSSAAVESTRKKQWSSNFSLSRDPEDSWFEVLCEKYAIPDDLSLDMKVKVLSLWQESRMNAYNSTPCTIAYDVGFETVSEIEVRALELEGIDITESTSRIYPQGPVACHTVGYISKIPSTRIDEFRSQGYPNDAFIGADGIESSLEDQLSPYIEYRQGKRVVEVNTRGKVVRELSYEAPTDGNSVVLTIDTDLQKVMADALADNIEQIRAKQEETIKTGHWQRRNASTLALYEKNDWEISLANSGAIVAMDPHSGKILGMVSYPDYDLSFFNGGTISSGDWATIGEGNDPLFNRAISTRDAPGSVFKLCTALAGLAEGKVTLDEEIDDLGSFTLTDSSHPAKCWTSYPENHQNQTVIDAIKNSCNYYFYTVGYRLGSTDLYKWAAALGLTSKTNIELPGETTSFVGNQDMLYDPDMPINSQYTYKPQLAAEAVRNKILQIAEERNIEYNEDRVDEVVKKILDIAVSYNNKSEWNQPIREILLYDLNLPENYIASNYIGNSMVSFIQELFWTPNETIMVAIGQSITQVSPIAVARYTCAIANGGTVYDAQIVDKIIAPDGTVVLDKQPVIANQISANEAYYAAIKRGMEDVTSSEDGGTAGKYFEGIDYIAGKTGTSQRTELDVENNAWMVCYAPLDDPQIVVVAYVQNGYSGAYTAPCIIETINYYLSSLGYLESSVATTDFSIAS
ncbi:MAG: penicillin-binding transpeptidase domain-containing protein [Christensenellales bacterium]|nr:penicillin-binding transpeptidase domain-containing protein [Christensenellales bacterium]